MLLRVQVFIGITSGPAHAELREAIRLSWIQECLEHRRDNYTSISQCDYRFFVDTFAEVMHRTAKKLLPENLDDVVFRDSCDLMQRHPSTVNYGSTPPFKDDYRERRMYKIDWKVCFLKWMYNNNIHPEYVVLVEDDSYVCTGNLLHQLSILQSLPFKESVAPFRTGNSLKATALYNSL